MEFNDGYSANFNHRTALSSVSPPPPQRQHNPNQKQRADAGFGDGEVLVYGGAAGDVVGLLGADDEFGGADDAGAVGGVVPVIGVAEAGPREGVVAGVDRLLAVGEPVVIVFAIDTGEPGGAALVLSRPVADRDGVGGRPVDGGAEDTGGGDENIHGEEVRGIVRHAQRLLGAGSDAGGIVHIELVCARIHVAFEFGVEGDPRFVADVVGACGGRADVGHIIVRPRAALHQRQSFEIGGAADVGGDELRIVERQQVVIRGEREEVLRAGHRLRVGARSCRQQRRKQCA